MCQAPKLGVRQWLVGISGDAEETSQHADDIPIENWPWLVEGDAADGSSGVAADSRQRENILVIVGEFSAVLSHNLRRVFLQIARASVIAEAFSQLEDFLRRRFCEVMQRWQFTHPPFPIRDDSFDLRLLEHDL